MTSIAEVISFKFPDRQGMVCREVDGAVRIVEFPGGIPSQADQDTWTAEYEAFVVAGGLKEREVDRQFQATTIQRLIFLIEFDQENRIRVLEGGPQITIAQYRDALIARYKAPS